MPRTTEYRVCCREYKGGSEVRSETKTKTKNEAVAMARHLLMRYEDKALKVEVLKRDGSVVFVDTTRGFSSALLKHNTFFEQRRESRKLGREEFEIVATLNKKIDELTQANESLHQALVMMEKTVASQARTITALRSLVEEELEKEDDYGPELGGDA